MLAFAARIFLPKLVASPVTSVYAAQCLVTLFTLVSVGSGQLYYGNPYAAAHLHSAPLLAAPRLLAASYHAAPVAIAAPLAYPAAPLSNAWASHYPNAPVYAPLIRGYYK